LEKIADSGEGREVELTTVRITPGTDDLKTAIAACMVAKGSHEYEEYAEIR
jgi:hypothetical protein